MTAIRSTFLRTVIALDAAACGLMGGAFAIAAPALQAPLGLSPALLQPIGLFLVAYAGFLAWLASKPELPRKAVWGLVAFNLLWAVESIGLLAIGWAQPTALGVGFVVVQALAAVVVADLQYLSVRRSRPAAGAA